MTHDPPPTTHHPPPRVEGIPAVGADGTGGMLRKGTSSESVTRGEQDNLDERIVDRPWPTTLVGVAGSSQIHGTGGTFWSGGC